MDHRFEGSNEAELAATPEQVWEAIATGPGIDSWFMGRNEVEPGEGGAVRTAFGDYSPDATVTAWEPRRRFAYRSGPGEDGRFIAYEFLIGSRGGGGSVLQMVTSGFLPGDDWEEEYDAMTQGGELFFRTLVEYLTWFPGRTATPVTLFGPPASGEWESARPVLYRALGLPGSATRGDRVRFTPEGLEPIDGVLYFVNRDTLGIRTGDALYPDWMRNGVRALADVLPNARHRTLEGQTHLVKPAALAPVLVEFFQSQRRLEEAGP